MNYLRLLVFLVSSFCVAQTLPCPAPATLLINMGTGLVTCTPVSVPTTANSFVSGYSSTTLRNNYTGFVGFKFTVGTNPISVNMLGRMVANGNNQFHIVKLVNASTGMDVPNGAVSINTIGATPLQFKYAPLSTPITLQANTSYYVVSQEVYGGDMWFEAGPITTTNDAIVNSAIFYTGGWSWSTYGNANTSYGPPNFQYTLSTAPTPTPVGKSYADPKTVLVLWQANTGLEPGTGTTNSSEWVAKYYAARRNIPTNNLLQISTNVFIQGGYPGCLPGGNCDVPGSENLTTPDCNTLILAPVKAALIANPAIKYVVPVYGVPVTCYDPTSTDPNRDYSLDNMIAGILITGPNPYYNADPLSTPVHIDAMTARIMLVSRLDGSTALQAAGLVDKAIAGETTGVHGVGYFDYQGLGTASLGGVDVSMKNAYDLCSKISSLTCVLNNQLNGVGMIKSAPNTAWAWGWYDLSAANASAYTFVPGAVGAQLNSATAWHIRTPYPGAYVYYWLNQGIAATWGAVSEPYANWYALGDNLLNHLWHGYTFGEAAYISDPTLNWKMVFVGDPLYKPF